MKLHNTDSRAILLLLGLLAALASPGWAQDVGPVYQVSSITGSVYWKRSRTEKAYRRLNPNNPADRKRFFYGGERLSCPKGSTLFLKKMRQANRETLLEGPLTDWPVPHLAPVNNGEGALRNSKRPGHDASSPAPDKKNLVRFPLQQADDEVPTDNMNDSGPGHVVPTVPVTVPNSPPQPVSAEPPRSPLPGVLLSLGALGAVAGAGYWLFKRRKPS